MTTSSAHTYYTTMLINSALEAGQKLLILEESADLRPRLGDAQNGLDLALTHALKDADYGSYVDQEENYEDIVRPDDKFEAARSAISALEEVESCLSMLGLHHQHEARQAIKAANRALRADIKKILDQEEWEDLQDALVELPS